MRVDVQALIFEASFWYVGEKFQPGSVAIYILWGWPECCSSFLRWPFSYGIASPSHACTVVWGSSAGAWVCGLY